MKKLFAFVTTVGAIALASGLPLSAQNGGRGPLDLSGEWAPLFHEDQPERIPGLSSQYCFESGPKTT